LEEQLVRAAGVLGALEEVVEADLVQRGGTGVGGDVAADGDPGRWARCTMIAAFQRIIRRISRSIFSSPGNHGSRSGGIELM